MKNVNMGYTLSMKISATQYNLEQLALEVYISGCEGNCKGCHNAELKDYNVGSNFREWFKPIKDKLGCSNIIKQLWIMGGEPLDQNLTNLEELILTIRSYSDDIKIWLWTRHPLDAIPIWVRELFDYIKCGVYDSTLPCKIEQGIKLASSNQHIYTKYTHY